MVVAGAERPRLSSDLNPVFEATEREVADRFARMFPNTRHLKIGQDEEYQESRIDRALVCRDVIIGFFEIKSTKYRFRELSDFITSKSKIETLRHFRAIVRQPVFYVVRFGDNRVGYFDVEELHFSIANWGRYDRGAASDIEPGARYQWCQFKLVTAPT